jgi:ribosomal protein L7/L12
MKKKDLLKRLNKLTKLIAKTEPDVEPDTHLFSQHSINHERHVMMVQEERYTHREMVNIMEESNHIWTIRNKIHNGEWDVLPLVQLEKEIKDFISQGQKINAIKHYRNVMDRDFGTTIALRLAKYTVDALAQNIQVDLTIGYDQPS